MLDGIRRMKIFGNEIEIDKEIKEFGKSVKKAEQEVPITQPSKTEVDSNSDILKTAEENPRIAILLLAAEIEKTLRELIASLGLLDGKNYTNVRQAFDLLERRGSLPKHVLGSVQIFFDLRNKIAHGKDPDNTDSAIGVLDIGMTLLSTLRSIPHETNVVYRTGVDLYRDKDCNVKRVDVSGIILETRSPGGAKIDYRIFPTTKPAYYTIGKKVAWEWNLTNIWGPSWYFDPISGDKTVAWLSAGEFVGRHIEEV